MPKSVRIIKCNNLLCQVNVSCQFLNQFKYNRYKTLNTLENEKRCKPNNKKYMRLKISLSLSASRANLRYRKRPRIPCCISLNSQDLFHLEISFNNGNLHSEVTPLGVGRPFVRRPTPPCVLVIHKLSKTLLPFVLLIWKRDICTSRTVTF
ncbi:hypothetical protein PO909_032703 [Leuciscus waleckii]